jgi:hypothetical protein
MKGSPGSSSHDFSREQLTTLRQTVIDKLQVLTLRRPRALIVVAQVLDGLLHEHLKLLDEHLDSENVDGSETKTE